MATKKAPTKKVAAVKKPAPAKKACAKKACAQDEKGNGICRGGRGRTLGVLLRWRKGGRIRPFYFDAVVENQDARSTALLL